MPFTSTAAMLTQLDDFFSQGHCTDRIRRFIEENSDAFATLSFGNATSTNSAAGLTLYVVFQRYRTVVDSILEDFMASKKGTMAITSEQLAAAIHEEWNSPLHSFRFMCTNYITASLDYDDFLDFAHDLYAMTYCSQNSEEDETEGEVDARKEAESNAVNREIHYHKNEDLNEDSTLYNSDVNVSQGK